MNQSKTKEISLEDSFFSEIFEIFRDYQIKYPDYHEIPLIEIQISLENYLVRRFWGRIKIIGGLKRNDYQAFKEIYQERLIAFFLDIADETNTQYFNAWILKGEVD